MTLRERYFVNVLKAECFIVCRTTLYAGTTPEDHCEWVLPDGTRFKDLPAIEHDIREFKKWVIKWMRGRGWDFVVCPKYNEAGWQEDNVFAKYDWDISCLRRLCRIENDEILEAAIEAALQTVEVDGE